MKYVFAGNRAFVFKQMLKLDCDFAGIFAVENSFLERELQALNINYKIIKNKQSLIEDLKKLEFNCFVSNGCPYILPVSQMKKDNQLFINVHPSLLPDLRGKHPINGAILFGRKHGVTCHHMDDGIDTGSIITNLEIPITQEIDLALLYQLTFIAEGEVFKSAYNQNFEAGNLLNAEIEPIYYTRKKEDLFITKEHTLGEVLLKIRAFGIPSIAARFFRDGKEYKIIKAKTLNNDTLDALFKKYKDNQVVCAYDSNVVVKFRTCFVQFNMVDATGLKPGDDFFGFRLNET